MSKSQLAGIEAGKRPLPVARFATIARALGIPWELLVSTRAKEFEEKLRDEL